MYIHLFGDSLCKVNICYALTRCSLCIHRLSSIDFILFVCVWVYHSACWLQPQPEMTVTTEKSLRRSNIVLVLTVVVLLRCIWLVFWQISFSQLDVRAVHACLQSFLDTELVNISRSRQEITRVLPHYRICRFFLHLHMFSLCFWTNNEKFQNCKDNFVLACPVAKLICSWWEEMPALVQRSDKCEPYLGDKSEKWAI